MSTSTIEWLRLPGSSLVRASTVTASARARLLMISLRPFSTSSSRRTSARKAVRVTSLPVLRSV